MNSFNKQILVTGGPVVYPSNKTVTVAAGGRVDLFVEFCSNPPYSKVLWVTESRVFSPGHLTPDGILAHKITVGKKNLKIKG